MKLDTGGHPDYPYYLWVYKDGKPLRYLLTMRNIGTQSLINKKDAGDKPLHLFSYLRRLIDSFLE